jgi:hypothetical protein
LFSFSTFPLYRNPEDVFLNIFVVNAFISPFQLTKNSY